MKEREAHRERERESEGVEGQGKGSFLSLYRRLLRADTGLKSEMQADRRASKLFKNNMQRAKAQSPRLCQLIKPALFHDRIVLKTTLASCAYRSFENKMKNRSNNIMKYELSNKA